MIASDFKTQVLPVSRKLLRFAAQFLRDEEAARDVVQDVFLKLWQKRDELSDVGNIEAFAVRMTRNQCLDVIRADKSTELKKGQAGPQVHDSTDVHLNMELSETATQIKNLIGRLPDLQQRVMQLRDIEQFTFEEIEEITGLNANSIRVNLSRARKKVREELLKNEENEIRRNQEFTAKVL